MGKKVQSSVRIKIFSGRREGMRMLTGGELNSQDQSDDFEGRCFHDSIWMEMADSADQNGQLTLSSIFKKQPILKDDYVVELTLDNKAQQEEFISHQGEKY